MTPNWQNRTLYRGDNLDFMRSMNSNSVHLIATDPPFNKGRDFHATPESLAAGASFGDRWRWDEDVQPEWLDEIQDDWPNVWRVIDTSRAVYGDDMGAFLCFMAVRLMAMRRILREDGSIYLHCDPTASHYLKALMDAIFGRRQFRNEVVWCYTGPSNTKRWFPRKHDVLLFYAKGEKWVFNVDDVRVPYDRLNTQVSGGGIGGKLRGELRDSLLRKGKVPESWWPDVSPVGRIRNERVGYPTQKPLALYRRIVRASSNPGDVVFDPFAGCATTPVAAEIEGRRWVAADEWVGAWDVVVDRLESLGKRDGLSFVDVVQRSEPLVRTDTGEVSAPALKSLRRRYTPPTMKRERMLAELIDRDGMQCQGCGRQFDSPRYFEIDHKLPRSEGGSNDIENRALLCGPCNRLKGATLTLTGLRRQNRKDGFLVARLA